VKVYEGTNIRNVAIVGHGHAGKTSLVFCHALHLGEPVPGKAASTMARPNRLDEEEIARKMSLAASLAYWSGAIRKSTLSIPRLQHVRSRTSWCCR